MTTAIDAGSSGGAGTGPGGGAGTGPRPSGPPTPTPSKRAELLDTADLLLRTLELLDAREFDAFADLPTERVAFTSLLGYTRRAVANLAVAAHVPPARQDQSSAAVGLNAIARTDGPGLVSGWDGKVAPSDASRLVGRTSGLVGGERPDGSVPGGRHLPAADADFTSPRPLGPPRFVVGDRRLIGRVERGA